MTGHCVSELVEGARVDGVFYLKSREMRAARNGDAYLALEFGDRSGTIPGVLFRPQVDTASIPVGTVVRVRGTVTVFRAVQRVSVQSMVPADAWSPSDLMGASERPQAELAEQFSALVKSLQDASLRRLVRSVFSDRDFYDRFCVCPASSHSHHVFAHGLLEHTVSVARLCDAAADHYDAIDRDVLVTAALLHDCGVPDCIQFSSGIVETDRGLLLGHAVLGMTRVRAAAARIKVDERDLMRIEYAVLSHHGESRGAEGAATLEAMVLSQLDTVDIAACTFERAARNASRVEEAWTSAANPFGHRLYSPSAA